MLGIQLKGKKAFIAGVADDKGFGWAIAKALAEAGAEIIIGTWPPVYNIFLKSLASGKLDESMRLSDGSKMNFLKIYPLDAAYDAPEHVPEEIKTNKRYQNLSKYTISEVVQSVEEEFGPIDILVHSLANGPEAKKPLLETTREGYLAALSASSYSFVSLVTHFGPIMNPEPIPIEVLVMWVVPAMSIINFFGTTSDVYDWAVGKDFQADLLPDLDGNGLPDVFLEFPPLQLVWIEPDECGGNFISFLMGNSGGALVVESPFDAVPPLPPRPSLPGMVPGEDGETRPWCFLIQ